MSGELVGAEARFVTVRFDFTKAGSTSTVATGSNSVYTDYHATSNVTFLSWLEGDDELFHEYGHAWSLYYAYIVQQDPSLSAYLEARGLLGDARIGLVVQLEREGDDRGGLPSALRHCERPRLHPAEPRRPACSGRRWARGLPANRVPAVADDVNGQRKGRPEGRPFTPRSPCFYGWLGGMLMLDVWLPVPDVIVHCTAETAQILLVDGCPDRSRPGRSARNHCRT